MLGKSDSVAADIVWHIALRMSIILCDERGKPLRTV
jgi:hypothetical protein